MLLVDNLGYRFWEWLTNYGSPMKFLESDVLKCELL
jgi:cyanate lyase